MDGIETRLRRRLAELEDDRGSPGSTIAGVPEATRVDDECDPRRAGVAWDRQQAAAREDRTARERAEVRAALDRMAAGTYGLCEVCGHPIPPARLEARPTTTRCVEHAA
ncbi:TraR/DksA family transcriptional regulator [Isoptericola sp. NPDC057391]|uniref:TraR/DksA family transcriptional regulator n=1 Tax=Isoptericola sp. NPDC057391 TaxID=3346117 RepID=UPI00362FFE44